MSARCRRHIWSELAVRENDGLAVSLLWSRATGRVKVAVVDGRLHFEFHVAGADALAAFHHPFAYAAGCAPPSETPARLAGLVSHPKGAQSDDD